MLFRQEFLDGIREGRITLAFRRWRRPTVRAGGALLTAVGQLNIKSVERVALAQISAGDAMQAGYESRDALLADLRARTEGEIYRIELGSLREDPRIALRNAPAADPDEIEDLRRRLARLDAHAKDGPWTLRVLKLVKAHPGLRAADLCKLARQGRDDFKLNVRKLKALGLTESLEIGYRLSPRGKALLEKL